MLDRKVRWNKSAKFIPTSQIQQRLFSSTERKRLFSFSAQFYARLRLVARAVRYARIPVLVVSVYGIGYQQGIIDDSRDPERTRRALLNGVLAQVGIQSMADVEIVKDSDNRIVASRHSPTTRRVATIGKKIVQMGMVHVKQELDKAVVRVRESLPGDIAVEDLGMALAADKEFVQWTEALARLEGSWSYLLLKTKIPNAFVAEILPKRIFITVGMFHIIENDDELALVLGHEVSHLILGHASESNQMEMILRMIEVLLLSMDPTDGALTLAFVGGLAALRTSLSAAFSREHEREADELGIKLAAMACYDTRKAASVFKRLHDVEVVPKSARKLISFADTHPPSEDRYNDLVKASEEQNAERYAETTCSSVQNRMKKILWSLQ